MQPIYLEKISIQLQKSVNPDLVGITFFLSTSPFPFFISPYFSARHSPSKTFINEMYLFSPRCWARWIVDVSPP